MFRTPIDTRTAAQSSADRFFGARAEALAFPAAMDLCRNQVPTAVSDDATRFAAEARQSTSAHAFRPDFTAADWRVFMSFCTVRTLGADFRLVVPGRTDRTLRFVVSGSLWQVSGVSGKQAQLLMPGAIVGEDALFSDEPGALDVRTLEDTRVIELTLPRQKELTAACPAIAFKLLRAAGAVIAARSRASGLRAELAAN